MHEILKIFKPVYSSQANAAEIVKTQLIPAFELFFRDIEDSKLGVVEELARCIESLPDLELRSTFLPFLFELQAEPDNHWRYRKILGQQLSHLYRLYPLTIVSDSLVKLTMLLLHDRIAAVRQVAALAIGALYHRLSTPEYPEFVSGSVDTTPHLETLSEDILKFASSKIFSERQLFIRICAAAFSNEFHFSATSSLFLSKFVGLAHDRVSNVRLSLARAVSETMILNQIFAADPLVLACVEVLRKDEDELVSFYFSNDKVDENGAIHPDVIVTIAMETKLHHTTDLILHETENLNIEVPIVEPSKDAIESVIKSRSNTPELILVTATDDAEEKLVLHPKFEEKVPDEATKVQPFSPTQIENQMVEAIENVTFDKNDSLLSVPAPEPATVLSPVAE